jgi:hypothetical protein
MQWYAKPSNSLKINRVMIYFRLKQVLAKFNLVQQNGNEQWTEIESKLNRKSIKFVQPALRWWR